MLHDRHTWKRRRRILLQANKPHRDKPKQNMEQLTGLRFQASCYLSPSPKGRKKKILLQDKKLLKIASESRAQIPPYHYLSWSNLFG